MFYFEARVNREKSKIRGWLFVAVALLLCLPPSAAQEHMDEAARQARAQELLKKARVALGGEEAWDKLQSLSVRLKLQRFIKYASVQAPDKVVEKERILSGKVELDFLLPDRFLRKISTQTLGLFKYSFTEIVNGEKAWRDPPLSVRSSRGDNRVVDVRDVERTLTLQTQGAQQQVSLYTLMYLLLMPPSQPTQWHYQGDFPLADAVGEQPRQVHVLLGEAPDGFRPFWLFDPASHLPLGVAVAYVEAIRPSVIVEVAALDGGYLRRTYQRAAQERRARAKPARMHEMRWLLSDYRQLGGVLLPHRITILRDGEKIEELTVTRLKLNHDIDVKRFEGEPKVNWR